MASTEITLARPSKYLSGQAPSGFTTPPLEWFCRTWAVTHSTLSMWRSASNVRITYKELPGGRLDDLVEYEKSGSLKNVEGIDSPLGPGSWKWRGEGIFGLMKLITSHWEVLGCGERPGADGEPERWIVIWFQKTLFTEEGIDILTDRKEGLSEQTLGTIMASLKALDAPDMVAIVEKGMRPVDINLPWKLAT